MAFKSGQGWFIFSWPWKENLRAQWPSSRWGRFAEWPSFVMMRAVAYWSPKHPQWEIKILIIFPVDMCRYQHLMRLCFREREMSWMYFSGMAVFVNHSQLRISMNVCSCFKPKIDRLGSKFPLFRGLDTNLISTFKRERQEGERGRVAVRMGQRVHPTHMSRVPWVTASISTYSSGTGFLNEISPACWHFTSQENRASFRA